MQQVLIFVIIIGISAFYLISQVQPEIADWFDRDLKIATSTTKITPKSSTPSLKTTPARNASRSDAGGAKQTAKKSDISLYSGKIKIAGIRIQTLSAPSLITLTTNFQQNEEINITGWEMKTKNGNFLIPKGAEQINPASPALVLKDIIIKSGDIIYFSSDPNPFLERDKNFRPNKCLGYLSGYRNFTIPLPQTCPRPQADELPSFLNYWCKEYIKTLNSCQMPTSDGLAKYELLKDDNCLSYLNSNLNYNGCFSNYQKDQDFYSNQWHIYLDRKYKEIFSWTNEFDTLYLRDKNGLLVDKLEFGQRVCCD